MKRKRSTSMVSQTKRRRTESTRQPRKQQHRNPKGPYVLSVSGQTPFPDVYRCKMKYNLSKTLDGASLQTVVVSGFNANGMYDPDIAVGGQQPVGYDELSAIYAQYVVRACKCEATFVSDTASDRVVGGVFANTQGLHGSAIEDINPLLCQRNVKFAFLNNSSSGSSVKKVSMYKTTAEIVGQSLIDPSDFGSAISANPTRLWFYDIFVGSTDDTDTSFTCVVNVSLTYYVDFYDQKYLNLS